MQRRFAPPPYPAPYLEGVGSLPRELRPALTRRWTTPAQRDEARRTVARLRQLIRLARQRYERAAGVLIIPESPPAF